MEGPYFQIPNFEKTQNLGEALQIAKKIYQKISYYNDVFANIYKHINANILLFDCLQTENGLSIEIKSKIMDDFFAVP